MDTVRINPLIVSVSPTDHTLISPIQPTMHKGGLGKLLSIAAAVAIPFAAPAIAGSIAASGYLSATMTTFMTTVGGKMMVGAALGAVSAAVQGQNVLKGALMGGATTGIASYTGANDFSGKEGLGAAEGAAGLQGPNTYTGGFGSATAGIGAEQGAMLAEQTAAFGSNLAATPLSLTQLAKQTGSAVASKLKDPKALANITMQAVGNLLGEAAVPEGSLALLSPEEQALVEERTAELKILRDRDNEAYLTQIDLSKKYMVQAGQIDPTYFANQEANKSKVESGRTINKIKEQAALSDKTFTDNEANRFGLDANRLSASAYDTGFTTGLNTKNAYMNQAMSTMPKSAPTNYSKGLAGLQDVYKGQREEANEERDSYQTLFAGMNTTEGNTNEEAAKKAKLYDLEQQTNKVKATITT